MSTTMPLVSIIIPVYNGANYLRDAIDSCLSQIYKNIEIIVVNDGSCDATEEICKKYAGKIKYFYKKNGGVSSALNLGIEKSEGKYISWLSHDDYYLPNKISDEVAVSALAKNDCIIFSNYYVVNKNKKKILSINFKKKFPNLGINPQYLLIYTCSLNGCAMLIPRKIFDEYGKFDEKLKYTQDYKKWGEILECDFLYNKNYALCSRRHDMQDTETHAINNPENDTLWYYLISLLYVDKNYDKFLGYQESLYYFKDTFAHNSSMIKTNSLINKNSNFANVRIIKKNIRKKIPGFGYKVNYLYKAWNYLKIFGLKKLISKLINY